MSNKQEVQTTAENIAKKDIAIRTIGLERSTRARQAHHEIIRGLEGDNIAYARSVLDHWDEMDIHAKLTRKHGKFVSATAGSEHASSKEASPPTAILPAATPSTSAEAEVEKELGVRFVDAPQTSGWKGVKNLFFGDGDTTVFKAGFGPTPKRA